MKEYTFNAPAIYACPLINGDLSGLDYYGPELVEEYNQWCKDNPEYVSDVVSTDGDTFIGTFNGLQTEMLTYLALSRD